MCAHNTHIKEAVETYYAAETGTLVLRLFSRSGNSINTEKAASRTYTQHTSGRITNGQHASFYFLFFFLPFFLLFSNLICLINIFVHLNYISLSYREILRVIVFNFTSNKRFIYIKYFYLLHDF